MYQVNDQIVVPPDPVRWPAYPKGFIGQIIELEDYPAQEGEVWAMVAVVLNGRIHEARLVPVRADLEVINRRNPDEVTLGPPRGFRRMHTHSSVPS